MFISCYGKTKVLTIYTNPLTKSYTSLGKGKLLLAGRNNFDREIKFVAKVDGVTVEHNYVEWNDSYFYPIETGFIIKPQKNVVYSFMGIVPEGIPENKLVSLKIFDYLMDKEATNQNVIFERAISIAGNLDINKSAYIAQLGKLGIIVHLYGPNFSHSLEQYEDIQYHGSFPASEIPNQLNSGFGLVWDGNSIDTCSGDFGEYLQYNNPHKLSLYLASGIPVVIWDKAAEADFVREHNVGICVSSLNELKDKLSTISEDEYKNMLLNVQEISQLLQKGYYTRLALEKAESVIRVS